MTQSRLDYDYDCDLSYVGRIFERIDCNIDTLLL